MWRGKGNRRWVWRGKGNRRWIWREKKCGRWLQKGRKWQVGVDSKKRCRRWVWREVNRKTEGMGFESEGDCMWRVRKVVIVGMESEK